MIRMVFILLLTITGAPTVIALAYANVPLGSRDHIRAHLDESIYSGLEFLDRSDRFRDNALRGGQHPVEIWLASKILRHYPHPGFEADLRQGWRSVIGDEVWGVYQNLVAESHHRLRRQEEHLLRSAFTEDAKWSLGKAAMFNSWFLYALYPDMTVLEHQYKKRFFGESLPAWYGYGLTHRIYAYRILQAKHPVHARHLGIDRMRERAQAALYVEMWLDVLLSDLYFERVAFYLEQPSAGPLNPRWIERIIRDQNQDGGWSKPRSWRCFVETGIGGECTRGTSSAHPTFLAVYALAQYREGVTDGDVAAEEDLWTEGPVDALQP